MRCVHLKNETSLFLSCGQSDIRLASEHRCTYEQTPFCETTQNRLRHCTAQQRTHKLKKKTNEKTLDAFTPLIRRDKGKRHFTKNWTKTPLVGETKKTKTKIRSPKFVV